MFSTFPMKPSITTIHFQLLPLDLQEEGVLQACISSRKSSTAQSLPCWNGARQCLGKAGICLGQWHRGQVWAATTAVSRWITVRTCSWSPTGARQGLPSWFGSSASSILPNPGRQSRSLREARSLGQCCLRLLPLQGVCYKIWCDWLFTNIETNTICVRLESYVV